MASLSRTQAKVFRNRSPTRYLRIVERFRFSETSTLDRVPSVCWKEWNDLGIFCSEVNNLMVLFFVLIKSSGYLF